MEQSDTAWHVPNVEEKLNAYWKQKRKHEQVSLNHFKMLTWKQIPFMEHVPSKKKLRLYFTSGCHIYKGWLKWIKSFNLPEDCTSRETQSSRELSKLNFCNLLYQFCYWALFMYRMQYISALINNLTKVLSLEAAQCLTGHSIDKLQNFSNWYIYTCTSIISCHIHFIPAASCLILN